eukprot:CAMPEP_0206043130 /NCGR_PEP_ID=MMETSP1466-20131121/7737_1 /ASSEMBLY_ACC=CAM_ASM_001126 /TAXON_ID=44452 /ORGANISM="Pavlova gyrans, Strain CCMP608" /LENGTH=265 /DNA_ID=CAMNT_0053417899 /DNA_START=101 /DNA_END=899 /DNA_ORIENTATION=-
MPACRGVPRASGRPRQGRKAHIGGVARQAETPDGGCGLRPMAVPSAEVRLQRHSAAPPVADRSHCTASTSAESAHAEVAAPRHDEAVTASTSSDAPLLASTTIARLTSAPCTDPRRSHRRELLAAPSASLASKNPPLVMPCGSGLACAHHHADIRMAGYIAPTAHGAHFKCLSSSAQLDSFSIHSPMLSAVGMAKPPLLGGAGAAGASTAGAFFLLPKAMLVELEEAVQTEPSSQGREHDVMVLGQHRPHTLVKGALRHDYLDGA